MPDREDLDAQLGRLVGRLQRLAVGVLAVGEQQDHLPARRRPPAPLGAQPRPARSSERGWRARWRCRPPACPRGEVAPEQLHRRVVGGRRVGQRLAREGDQRRRDRPPAPSSSSLELALGPLEPRRVDVPWPASTSRSRAPPRGPARAASSSRARPPACGPGQRERPAAPAPATRDGAQHLARHRDPRGHARDQRLRRPGAPAAAAAARRRARRPAPPPAPAAAARARGDARTASGQPPQAREAQQRSRAASSSERRPRNLRVELGVEDAAVVDARLLQVLEDLLEPLGQRAGVGGQVRACRRSSTAICSSSLGFTGWCRAGAPCCRPSELSLSPARIV